MVCDGNGQLMLGRRSPPKIDGGCLMSSSKVRSSRATIIETIKHLKSMPAEEIRYRDRASNRVVDGRAPSAVLALLRLRASCTGKEISDEKISRAAADIMKEQAYDPVRAVASLQPASLLCPCSAMRVLGAGCIGVVFLEEESGVVVKVMLDDIANKEYKVFCAFADAGLAPRPISICGPQKVPGGDLWSIRMEAISQTFLGYLNNRVPRGPRKGLEPPTERATRRLAEALVKALQRMFEHGLVHGDLHLENVAVTDASTQPVVQMLDFGRAARNTAALQNCAAEALRSGHEYDVFRLMEEIFVAFEDVEESTAERLKECGKELRELRKDATAVALAKNPSVADSMVGDPFLISQLHNARQINGLQAYMVDEPEALERAEVAYNSVLAAVSDYAKAKLDLHYEGSASVRNRRLKQAVSRRVRLCYSGYFHSSLFWDD